jgi:hypothetical protein
MLERRSCDLRLILAIEEIRLITIHFPAKGHESYSHLLRVAHASVLLSAGSMSGILQHSPMDTYEGCLTKS